MKLTKNKQMKIIKEMMNNEHVRVDVRVYSRDALEFFEIRKLARTYNLHEIALNNNNTYWTNFHNAENKEDYLDGDILLTIFEP